MKNKDIPQDETAKLLSTTTDEEKKVIVKALEDYRRQKAGEPNPKLKPLLRDLIKNKEDEGGIEFEEIKKFVKVSNEELNKVVKQMLEDGEIYEPRPSKLRWLG